MKKGIVLVAVFFFFFSLITANGAKKKEDKYENWIKEEIKLLIAPEEEAEFKNLKTDEEKDQFIEVFWAKRDPSSGTKENEFRDEWYKRLEYVTKSFTRGTAKGWHSDQGRVYMFFGPPSQTASTGPVNREEAFGGSQIEAPTEIWIYQPMPDLGLTDAFRVTFREYQYGYDLDHQTSQKILHALEIFPKVVMFNADLQELPRFKFLLEENSFEGKLIKDFVSSGAEVKGIAFGWTPIFTRAQGGDTYVSLLVQIDPQKLDRKKLKELTFFGKVKIGEGEESEDFLKTIKIEKEKEDRILTLFGFPAKPGKSVLFLGLRDKDKENYSLIKSDLDVADFSSDALNTSSIILSAEVVQTPGASGAEGEFNPYISSDFRATPRWGNVFKKNEFLNVLYQIYNAKAENDAIHLVIDYFVISEKVGYRLNPQTIQQKIEAGKGLAAGTQIALSPLEPDKYTFKIKITDKIANQVIEKTVPFVVE